MRRPVTLLLVLIFLFALATPAFAQESLAVYYAGDPDSSVLDALELAEFDFVDEPEQADVIVLNGTIPNAQQIASQVGGGTGLVLIMGSQVEASDAEKVLGIPIDLEIRDAPVSLTEVPLNDPLTSEIIWNSAPQIRQRAVTITPISAVQPLVTTYEDGSWVLWQARPNILVFNAFLKMSRTTRKSSSGPITTT